MQLLHDIYDNFVKNLLKGPANRHRARINKSAPMLQELSVWTTPLSNHVKSAPYLLYFFLPFFRKNWLNISTPQLANCGPSNVLPIAKSVLFSFACSNQNLAHFLVSLLTLILKKKDFMVPFNCLKAAEPLWRGSLLFNTKTITSNLTYGKSFFNMVHPLMPPLYNQSGNVAIFAN